MLDLDYALTINRELQHRLKDWEESLQIIQVTNDKYDDGMWSKTLGTKVKLLPAA